MAALARLVTGRRSKWLVFAAWIVVVVVMAPLGSKLRDGRKLSKSSVVTYRDRHGVVSSARSGYAFIFLVALGIDYTIFLMSRVREERASTAPARGRCARWPPPDPSSRARGSSSRARSPC